VLETTSQTERPTKGDQGDKNPDEKTFHGESQSLTRINVVPMIPNLNYLAIPESKNVDDRQGVTPKKNAAEQSRQLVVQRPAE
jgi:hypothetical protein